MNSASKGAARWVVLAIIGALVLVVAIFMIVGSTCSRQSAPEKSQAQSAEDSEAADDDAVPSTYSFELPEI